MTRREHIEQLAAELGATIQYGAPRYGMAADTVTRTLHLAAWPGMEVAPSPEIILRALFTGRVLGEEVPEEVPEEEVYWVALHEMGHLETTPHPGARVESQLEDEARAWAWALEHSIFPLDTAGQSAIAWGLTDRVRSYGLDSETTEAMRKILDTLGPEPDWMQNVVTEAHFDKLNGWAKPSWAKLIAQAEAARS